MLECLSIKIHSYLTGIFPAVSKLILEALWVPSDTKKTLEICQARVSMDSPFQQSSADPDSLKPIGTENSELEWILRICRHFLQSGPYLILKHFVLQPRWLGSVSTSFSPASSAALGFDTT
jgi:hypothetical protein